MKLIRHIISVDMDENKKLLLNALNGRMDEVSTLAFETLSKWKECSEIIPDGEDEIRLFQNLSARGYMVLNDEEEISRKNTLLDALRKRQHEDREKCRVMTFIMTYDCNFRCPYCFEEGIEKRKGIMTPELIDAALNLAGDGLEVVGLFGGEPLLPETKSAVEYIISKLPDKLFEITTNGYYLEEFFDLLSTANIQRILVTLDGEEDAHDSRRFLESGERTFKKITDGVSKYLEAGIPICVRMNVDSSNFDDCNRLQERLLNKYKNNDVLTFEMAPMLGAADKERNNLITDMYKRGVKLTREERIRKNNLITTNNPIINSFTAAQTMSPLYSFCYAHENKLAVDPYGNIFTCLITVGMDDLAAGKYYPVVEFKENSIYNRNIDTIPECRDCIYSLLCGGGCAMTLPSYDDWLRPACSVVKNQVHQLLPKLYKAKLQEEADAAV